MFIAEYYERGLGKDMALLMAGDYRKAGMGVEDVVGAWNKWRSRPNCTRMPTPGDLSAIFNPKLNPRDEAIRRISMIKEAIRKHGFYNPTDGRKFLGEIIWNDVCRMGGWRHLCESPDANLRDSITYAQARDALTSSVQAERDGINYEAPALPGAENKVLEIVREGAEKLSLERGTNENTDNQRSGGISSPKRREDN